QGLAADDIAGIRAIYSKGLPRSYDSVNGLNNSFVTAADVSFLMDPNRLSVTVTGRDITVPSQQSFYTIVAPVGTTGTLTATVQSAGLSLLSPVMTLYDAAGNVLGSDGWSGRSATTLSVTTKGVQAGQRFYVRVTGADNSPMSVGAYGMTFKFSTAAPWQIPIPNTATPNGNPLSSGGRQATNVLDEVRPSTDTTHAHAAAGNSTGPMDRE